MSKTHLVIGDSHAKPGVSNERFTWLGRLIADIRPDVVVDMGDFADMPSLSSYDRGKASFEGRRYNRDIAANVDARTRILKELGRFEPHMIALMGNHQQRIVRMANNNPELSETLGYDNLRDTEFGWDRYDFLEPALLDGITYTHYVTSGNAGRPVSGENPACTILKKQHVSMTTAHSHFRDFAERTKGNGQKICGLVAGCYFEHKEEWAGKQANDGWWRGLVICHNVKDGYYDPEFINIAEVKRRYGSK